MNFNKLSKIVEVFSNQRRDAHTLTHFKRHRLDGALSSFQLALPCPWRPVCFNKPHSSKGRRMSQSVQNDPSRRWIVLLVVALAAWGLYHAIGAFLFNKDVRRGLVVLACMALFLAFWLSLLMLRKKRQRSNRG
jgi:predicted permease